MENRILIYFGSIISVIWGAAHLFPTKGVVKGFREISADNKNIITMEWKVEGILLIFIGAIVAGVTNIDPFSVVSGFICLSSSAALIILTLVSLFTGFKVNLLPFKLCPVLFAASAVLIFPGCSL